MGGTSTDICLVVDGAADAGDEPPGRRPPHRAQLASTSPASAPAAARSRGSMPAASCMSGRKAPARCRDPPATARAAPRDRDRRQSGARLSRPGEFSRRRPAGSTAPPPSARSTGSPPRSASTGSRRRAASTASSTPTWPRGCGSSRCGAASIRAGSRCSPSAARPGCTRPTSRASSGSRGSSCRASPRCCRPGACWRPICASRWRAAISATPARSTAPRSSACSTRWRPRACAACAPRSPGRRGRRASVDMRYGEQVFEITVPLDDVDWSAADPLPQIVERFHRRHEALYTYSMPDQESVLVNARVAVVRHPRGIAAGADLPAGAASPARAASAGSISTIGSPRRSTVSTRWPRAQTIAGPAIVEFGDDDRAAAPRRARHGHAARLARHRRLTTRR